MTIVRPGQGRLVRGFSLTELMVAVAVLALAVVPVFDLLIGSARQARQTADYGLAMAVGEKVSSDLRLANWENIHCADIILASSDQAGLRPVVNAQSPFFDVIEDAAPPYGRIRSGEDPAINARSGALYTELESFSVGTEPRVKTLANGGEVVDVGLVVAWNDFKKASVKSPVAVSLARHGAPPVPPAATEDRDLADDAIRKALYPDLTGLTLAQAASRTGAQLDLLRQLGDVVVVLADLTTLRQEISTQVGTATAALARATTAREKAERYLELARLHERGGAIHVNAMIYLTEPVRQLATSFEVGRLGSRPPDATRYKAAVASLDSVRTRFVTFVSSAREAYAKAYGGAVGDSLPPRVRVRVFMKLLNMRQLEILTAGPQDLDSLRTMLADFAEFHEGRNPNFLLFAEYELARCGSVDALRQAYPAQERIQAYEVFRDEVRKAVGKVVNGAG